MRPPRQQGLFRARRTGWISPRFLVTDDAAQEHPLALDPKTIRNPRTKKAWWSFKERVLRNDPRLQTLGVFGPGVVVLAVVALIPNIPLPGGRSFSLAPFVGVVVYAALLAWLVPRIASRGTAASVIGERVREQRCGICGYDLRTTPEDSAGRRVCPECGAAWSIEKWRRDAPGERIRSAASLFKGHNDHRGLPLPRRTAAREAEAAARAAHGFLSWQGLADVALLLALGAYAAWMWAANDPRDRLGMLVISAFCVGIPALLVRYAYVRDGARRQIFREEIARHRCPGCGGPLRMECSMLDGCRLCEACGGAWRDA